MLKIQEDRGTSASAQNTNVTNSTVLNEYIYIWVKEIIFKELFYRTNSYYEHNCNSKGACYSDP